MAIIISNFSSGQDLVKNNLPEIKITGSAEIFTITYNKLKFISTNIQYLPNQIYFYEQIQMCNGKLKDSSTAQIISLEKKPTNSKDFKVINSQRYCNSALRHIIQYNFQINKSIDRPKITQRATQKWNKYTKSSGTTQNGNIIVLLLNSKGDTISIMLDSLTFNVTQITYTYNTHLHGRVKKLNSNQDAKAKHQVTVYFKHVDNIVYVASVLNRINTEVFDQNTNKFYPFLLMSKLQEVTNDDVQDLPENLRSLISYLPCNAYFLE